MSIETMPTKIHHGRNIKRLRDILGVKQEAIALELNMTQQAVSKLEQKPEIENELIEKVAKILNFPAEAIKNFDEQATVSFISNTFQDEVAKILNFPAKAIKNFNEQATVSFISNTFQDESVAFGYLETSNFKCTFNPLDKVVELYERMLKIE